MSQGRTASLLRCSSLRIASRISRTIHGGEPDLARADADADGKAESSGQGERTGSELQFAPEAHQFQPVGIQSPRVCGDSAARVATRTPRTHESTRAHTQAHETANCIRLHQRTHTLVAESPYSSPLLIRPQILSSLHSRQHHSQHLPFPAPVVSNLSIQPQSRPA